MLHVGTVGAFATHPSANVAQIPGENSLTSRRMRRRLVDTLRTPETSLQRDPNTLSASAGLLRLITQKGRTHRKRLIFDLNLRRRNWLELRLRRPRTLSNRGNLLPNAL